MFASITQATESTGVDTGYLAHEKWGIAICAVVILIALLMGAANEATVQLRNRKASNNALFNGCVVACIVLVIMGLGPVTGHSNRVNAHKRSAEEAAIDVFVESTQIVVTDRNIHADTLTLDMGNNCTFDVDYDYDPDKGVTRAHTVIPTGARQSFATADHALDLAAAMCPATP